MVNSLSHSTQGDREQKSNWCRLCSHTSDRGSWGNTSHWSAFTQNWWMVHWALPLNLPQTPTFTKTHTQRPQERSPTQEPLLLFPPPPYPAGMQPLNHKEPTRLSTESNSQHRWPWASRLTNPKALSSDFLKSQAASPAQLPTWPLCCCSFCPGTFLASLSLALVNSP